MTDRYEIGRINHNRVHLLDTTIPEPVNGGDRSQIVCDLFTAGPYIWDRIRTMPDEPGSFGSPVPEPACGNCFAIAWSELMRRTA